MTTVSLSSELDSSTLVWRYADCQSGDVRYSLLEPERGENSRFHITEITLAQVPAWALQQLEMEV